jgi:hypothetical protein
MEMPVKIMNLNTQLLIYDNNRRRATLIFFEVSNGFVTRYVFLDLQTRFDLEKASHPLCKDIATIRPRETV